MLTAAAPDPDPAPAASALPATVSLMGLSIAAISERETIAHVLHGIAERRGGWICPVNLDVMRQWHRSEDARRLVSQADLVVADGMPLLWAGELQGTPLPERVAGSTLVMTLSGAAAAAGASLFLLGGNPGTADAAVGKLVDRFPNVRLAGTMCPPVGFESDPEWLDRIDRALREAAPDIVYVAFGFPKQDRLIVRLRERMPETWFISCGVSFSFVAGEIQRAPVVVQRLGLEWLHRLLQEPERLYRRYLLQGIPFLLVLLRSALKQRLTRQPRLAP